MTIGLVGRKVGMTRIFTDDGTTLPVTVLDVSDNRVTQIKTAEKDGYAAVQVAFGKPGSLESGGHALGGQCAAAGRQGCIGFDELFIQIAELRLGGSRTNVGWCSAAGRSENQQGKNHHKIRQEISIHREATARLEDWLQD